mmetsp:Transcript_74/g.153  ORF Transcript_74/g.153 Transcript_74/m.153 type:complete len:209 (+) Transcript_74:64-690(+)
MQDFHRVLSQSPTFQLLHLVVQEVLRRERCRDFSQRPPWAPCIPHQLLQLIKQQTPPPREVPGLGSLPVLQPLQAHALPPARHRPHRPRARLGAADVRDPHVVIVGGRGKTPRFEVLLVGPQPRQAEQLGAHGHLGESGEEARRDLARAHRVPDGLRADAVGRSRHGHAREEVPRRVLGGLAGAPHRAAGLLRDQPLLHPEHNAARCG